MVLTMPMRQVRVTGVLVEDGRILLVRQRVTAAREWSLPGGRMESGESLEEAMIREMKEETGLSVSVRRLLYLAEKPEEALLHVTLELQREGGELRIPSHDLDSNPISDVRFVGVAELVEYGFTERWRDLVAAGFPGAPAYVGHKERIGL